MNMSHRHRPNTDKGKSQRKKEAKNRPSPVLQAFGIQDGPYDWDILEDLYYDTAEDPEESFLNMAAKGDNHLEPFTRGICPNCGAAVHQFMASGDCYTFKVRWMYVCNGCRTMTSIAVHNAVLHKDFIPFVMYGEEKFRIELHPEYGSVRVIDKEPKLLYD